MDYYTKLLDLLPEGKEASYRKKYIKWVNIDFCCFKRTNLLDSERDYILKSTIGFAWMVILLDQAIIYFLLGQYNLYYTGIWSFSTFPLIIL